MNIKNIDAKSNLIYRCKDCEELFEVNKRESAMIRKGEKEEPSLCPNCLDTKKQVEEDYFNE